VTQRLEPPPATAAERPAAAPSRGRRPLPLELLRACRPRQWAKNLLLLAAPLAAGAITHRDVLANTLVGVACFCLLSSGAYLLNDRRDVWRDRAHPRKRERPIASGAVPLRLAAATGIALVLAGLAAGATLGVRFVAVELVYVGVSTAYSLGLREVAVLDLAIVASLFIVRAVAGGVAADVPLSRWFLVVTSFSALYVVVGKRASEQAHASAITTSTRRTLDEYSPEYLRALCVMSSTVAIAAYCLWAFARRGPDQVPWFELSIVPFVLGMMRYGLLIDRGGAEAPEEALLADRFVAITALAWVAVFCAGAYGVG
jgi:decaprenyl-phosphate phosphoribosyltransferase